MHNTNTMPGLVRGGHYKNSPEGYQRIQSGCYLQMKKSRSLQKLSPSKTNHYEHGRQTYCMKRTKSYYEAMGLKVDDKREMFPGKRELFPGGREKLSRSKSEGLICAENAREKCNSKEGKVKNSGYFSVHICCIFCFFYFILVFLLCKVSILVSYCHYMFTPHPLSSISGWWLLALKQFTQLLQNILFSLKGCCPAWNYIKCIALDATGSQVKSFSI